MSVSSTSNTPASSNASDVTKSGYDSFDDVGIDEFLDLMITELQNQDPLNPMDNAQMLEQINQIREIASNQNLTETLDSVMLGQNMSTASGMIGKTVEALDNNGSNFTGEVSKVGIIDGVPTLYCTETVSKYDDETGELVSQETVEHEVSLSNVAYVVPSEKVEATDPALLSQQLSAANAMVDKMIIAAEGEELLELESSNGNVTEKRGETVEGLAGIVEKTIVEDGEAKLQILVPAGAATEDDPEPKDKRYVVSLSNVEQVVPITEATDPYKLTEDLAVASSMVGREVVGSYTDEESGESTAIGGWVQQVYVNEGEVMLALQQDDGKGTLYGLALDEVTNVYNYAEGYEVTETADDTTSTD